MELSPQSHRDTLIASQIRQFRIPEAGKGKNCHRIELDFFQKGAHK